MAPTCRVTSRPSLNNAIVGIALMRKRRARFCASSVLTFATTHLPAPSCATLFSSGATILHGPHHGAQKSTNTGRAERAVKASNARSFATSIGSPGALSSVPHFPQRPVPPSLSYFRRLRWPHFGRSPIHRGHPVVSSSSKTLSSQPTSVGRHLHGNN